MRITQQMLSSNITSQLQQNLSRYEKANEQVSTGKRINTPSDDPIGVQKSLKLASQLADNEQYERNTDYALSWMETTDQALNSISNALQRANELGLQASNGTNSPEDQQTIAKEIEQLRAEIQDIANTKFDGKYIFNGQKTDQPIQIAANGDLTYNNQPLMQRMSSSNTIEMNVTGEVFDGKVNLFKTFDQLSGALASGDQEGVSSALEQIETGKEQVLNSWTTLGAKQSRVEGMSQRLKEENLSLQTLVSKNDDVDFAEAIMKLKTEESVYQASLAASAKIIQPSLLDFLR
ncbi:flagellar hook-associated protein FlgL [Pseudalkalibacillus hwajinpoensis]|uniref:flagellar hook-associated protein FlgL n=1 Tax=Guptibacillus hwajinpoensis TaxID=208199 RepID=UPI001CD475E0|nr:flagellar hook-associated protein FlgL [Pseudalkalibacillus hwajinpoensis]MCA0991130.1 flagellar hook-associated protein FlgL [Pseudalkalibacillus hwajinpoensis]